MTICVRDPISIGAITRPYFTIFFNNMILLDNKFYLKYSLYLYTIIAVRIKLCNVHTLIMFI